MHDLARTAPAPSSSPSSSPVSPTAGTQELDSTDHRYAFTPLTLKKAPPRAWERRPATPFAPRTESHKIWKRSEQILGMRSDARENIINGKRESERWRSVKRRRVAGARFADENGDGVLSRDFLGTSFEELGDVDAEKRRKLVNGSLYGDVCMAAVKERCCGNELPDVQATKSLPEDLDEDEGNYELPTATRQCSQEKDISLTPHNQVEQKMSSISFVETGAGSSFTKLAADFHGTGSPMSAKRTHRRISPCTKNTTEQVPETSHMNEGDDTELLHAFLTRAKAKKAARTMFSPKGRASNDKPKMTMFSPQTRSRTALIATGSNSPSPRKTRNLLALEAKLEQDDKILPEMKAASPLRKSSRTRLPRPQRHQLTTPSSIPFRRSNGTEFIFLRKTEAQQVAMATRSNTRRNKGEAVQPKMKLEALSSQSQPSPVKVARRRKNKKQVAWDEGLAYFAPEALQLMEEDQQQTEPKTPAKRSRRLAPGEGTPAPKKKMAEATMDLGTPGSRTRTRTRTKGKV